MSTFKTDKLKPCQCGYKPDSYNVWYGRTPYNIVCENCKKQLASAKCQVTGSSLHLFDYWNNHIADLTVEQMKEENRLLRLEIEAQSTIERPREYIYYWYDGAEHLHAVYY